MKYFMIFITILFDVQFTIMSAQALNRGFIHPGGLHTQADFDRVKAQLAKGNTKVKQAYEILKSAAYAQPSVQTYPVETIIRGGGSGENYMNAARGAAMAYQNALRWKIEDNTECADAAVRILMAWATTTKAIGGDTNYALAAGLYGYAFAQAAELMRDYKGWSSEDFSIFRQWMLTVWYPTSLSFLRSRNGTWENGGKWWQAPGHYWSNWGLCNAICVVSIGVLCDDVFIYNQGMSYFKYDQVGNFVNPPTLHDITGHGDADGGKCIHNDGLTEFLGNLVVTDVESELETGAYGRLGQLNESGRDAGHSAMSLGLAVDMAKIGWNQGDDLFAYMNHRLASGIEYLAAQAMSIEGLPWTDYMYGTNGYYYSDGRAWLMTVPVLGAQMRPYWGTVIGIYEGVKGIKMPFAEKAYEQMGIDGGAQGSTSGGYDHMGYSVLMNTRDEQLCHEERRPTELSPKMVYSGTIDDNLIPSLDREKERGLVSGNTIFHNEMGGLVNTYQVNNNTCPPVGHTLTLMPQLPESEENSGQWRWNTGETTQNITVTTNRSYVYRVTYTNNNGIESQLCFPIAAAVKENYTIRGDFNGDEEVGMPDLMFLLQKILNGKFPDEE
ncbi:MAG: alginate lyase family protein [Prevotella sp.]|nr:alginate lyase family protein [Prevotella sp.]